MPRTSTPCETYPGSASWPLWCIDTQGRDVPCSQVANYQAAPGLYYRYRKGPQGEMCIGQGAAIVGQGIGTEFVSGTIEDAYITITDDWVFWTSVAVAATVGIVSIWLLIREIART